MVEIIPNWHPIFVHFSVALLSISVILFVFTKVTTNWRLEDQWLATAYWNLWLGTLLSLGTVAAGWFAFNSVEHDTPSHAVMLEHRTLAFATLGVFVVMSVWGIIQYKSQNSPSIIFVIMLLVGLGLLGSTAWHGGELVYRHGIGVMSLPDPDDHSHAGGAQHDHEGAIGADHHDEPHAHDEAVASDHHADEAAAQDMDVMDGEPMGDPHDHSQDSEGGEHQHNGASDGHAH